MLQLFHLNTVKSLQHARPFIMILAIAVFSVVVVIALFILDTNRDQVINSRIATYLQPFSAETVVKHDYAVRPETVWKVLTRLSNYNCWFPGILRLMPLIQTDRYVHRYSFDQFNFMPGAFLRIRPFSLSPTYMGRIMAIENNKQLALEMRYSPVHKEIVVFNLDKTSKGTSVTCRRSSRGLFSWMTLWGFTNTKSKILDNLGYFIPDEIDDKKEAKTTEQDSGPQYSREAIIARAVQAGLEDNMDLINAIPDKPTRGMAKALLIQTKRKGGDMPDRFIKALDEEPVKGGAPGSTGEVSGSGTGLPSFANTDDLVAFVVNKALDGEEDPINAIDDKPTRGKAKALMVKIKRGSVERPPMPDDIPTVSPASAPTADQGSEKNEPEDALIARLVEAGVDGNMDEINALESRVLRGKIKAAVIKAKRASA